MLCLTYLYSVFGDWAIFFFRNRRGTVGREVFVGCVLSVIPLLLR